MKTCELSISGREDSKSRSPVVETYLAFEEQKDQYSQSIVLELSVRLGECGRLNLVSPKDMFRS